ncbi:MAG: murein biosynthesis integral membrane protein MurJ [Proteobacteria bacterium]|nr:murein biosynthesis integral membrane protein MurJ [Pseudomonadota bacterium]
MSDEGLQGDGRGTGRLEPRRLGAVAVLLAASVFLSRITGYLRDVVLANRVGAGPLTDAYYAAFQIPDLLNYLLAGGALSIAFLPLYARVRSRRGEEAAAQLFATVLGTLGLASAVATGLLWIYAEPLVALQFPGFADETRALTVRLTRIVLPAQIFFVTGGIVRAVLMAEGRFWAHALAPLLYNVSIVAGGLATGHVEGFAWGVLIGAVLGPWGVPILDLARSQRLRLRVAPFDPVFRGYLWIALPLMIGLSLTTVDEWYDRWIGNTLGVGVVAILGFARKLMQAPVAVVGQAVATAALPTLAHLWTSGRREELNRTLQRTLEGSAAVALLAGAACFVFARPLVEVIYRHGAFGSDDAARVASVLAVMAWAVPGWIVQQVAVRAFYAREDTWRPMILGTGVALAAIPLYLALSGRAGAEGLAAAGAVAMTANALATLCWARVRHGAPELPALARSGARAAFVAVLASVPCLYLLDALDPLGGQGTAGALLQLAVGGTVFAAIGGTGIALVGGEALRSLAARAWARLPFTGSPRE